MNSEEESVEEVGAAQVREVTQDEGAAQGAGAAQGGNVITGEIELGFKVPSLPSSPAG